MIAWDPSASVRDRVPRAIAFPGTDLIVTFVTQHPPAPIVDACRTAERDRDGRAVEGGWSAGGIAIAPLRKRGQPGLALVLALRGRLVPTLPETGMWGWLFRPGTD